MSLLGARAPIETFDAMEDSQSWNASAFMLRPARGPVTIHLATLGTVISSWGIGGGGARQLDVLMAILKERRPMQNMDVMMMALRQDLERGARQGEEQARIDVELRKRRRQEGQLGKRRAPNCPLAGRQV